ncbi:unnamed protein product [Triticum turgidum subsp. durum]|uniref:Uncharacterized protein n=1 Tax=Triticum turgidum subsp. durum TaxID=4567 RepID=A0A9R0YE88_TRITD|nr:unnamed protein product [Triticum turgidum subsp. durum]
MGQLVILKVGVDTAPTQTLTTLSSVSHHPLAAGAAMLRLRRGVLAQLLSSPSVSPLHRLLYATAPAAPCISPNPAFAVDDYLVRTCGLTRAQALKASAKLSHLKSRAKPDAVLSFLAGLGLSTADVASVVAKDPLFLCAKVYKTLAPNVAELTGLGLSPSEIARLVSLGPDRFRCRSIVSTPEYCLPLFGSYDNLLRALPRAGGSILGSDLDRVVKPNVTFLHECGLAACDIARLCIHTPLLLNISTERIRTAVACVEGLLGVPRGSLMFKHALQAVAFLSEDKITAKVEPLKKTFTWTDAEVGIAVSRAPSLLKRSEDSLQRMSEFLISEVGLEPAYIAHRPTLLTFSLKGRLRARHYVVKCLKENGLLSRNRDYYYAVKITGKEFVEKFICPHKEAAPHLAKDYAAACKDEVPTRFRFT